ncbi:NAD(P)-dependent oxidoreductase [Halobacteriales archaeon QS_3_64_16]|nr:MAG: NAD(P)-dependent oxidoreductase [Halobacteriales archaeon QS_3_64_16]
MPEAELHIEGEHAAITGAARGIGRRIAAALLDAGVNVAVNDVSQDALGEAAQDLGDRDGELLTHQGDAADPGTMKELIERTVAEFGGLDILVNNVGIAGPTKPLEEITHEEFFSTLEVNLGGLFDATRAAVPYLRASDAGRVVNLSSMSGKRPLPDRTPYTTAKMGVIGFTRTLATELAEDGITVNAICPGSVAGPRIDRVIEGQAESQNRPIEEVREEFREISPMNEFTQPEDVADAVLYLCSDRAARVTGEDLNVSAGVVMY